MKGRKLIALSASVLLGTALYAGGCFATTITIACSATGNDVQACADGAQAWAKKTGNEVKVVSSADAGRLALYQQLLSAGSADIDVLQIDLVWTGILAQYFTDLSKYAGARTAEYFPTIIKNDTVGGRLVAMPWYADAGVLFYRTDLLKKYGLGVPDTWEQLTAEAKQIQSAERAAGNGKMWGFVWQGRAYEGLACDALEWVASRNGGTIIDASGHATIDNPSAIAALNMARGWVGNISPEGVLNYAEEEARGVFQSGDAVFMRNWPYAWSLLNSPDSAVKGKVGVVVLPKGGENGQHAATAGGSELAVSKYSKHPELAADLVMYLTSAAEQKRRAIVGSYAPTIPALYKDEEVRSAGVPFLDSLYDSFVHSVARPSAITKIKYNQVSVAFSNATYSVLSGHSDAAASMKILEGKLDSMGRGGKW